MPHELLKEIEQGDEMAEMQFLSIIQKVKIPEGFFILPVDDVSGSMAGIPLEAGLAFSLIVAYSQKHRMVATFENVPRMYLLPELFGGDFKLKDVIGALRDMPWGNSTNFNACMDLMLKELVRRKREGLVSIRQNVLMVFTDMQFDVADHGGYATNLEVSCMTCCEFYFFSYKNMHASQVMERKFAEAGIPMPIVVFWNLRGNLNGGTAATHAKKKNTVILSGFNADMLEDFFHMLDSGDFSDMTAPCTEADDNEEAAATQGPKPALTTAAYVERILQSDMYAKYF